MSRPRDQEDLVDITITAPDEGWLMGFATALVADRLVASGNVAPGIRTVYRWGTDVLDTSEAYVTLHTRRGRVGDVLERARRDHPYDVPGFRVTGVEASPEYRRWVIESTTDDDPEGPQ